MKYLYKEEEYKFTRYPKTSDSALMPWSAADEHLLQYFEELEKEKNKIVLYNDRFGFLSCLLSDCDLIAVMSNKSQEKACLCNLGANELAMANIEFTTPLSDIQYSVDIALIKIPKSLELFRLYLYHLSKTMDINGVVICAFMTKHFSPMMVKISEEFFEDVKQSRAFKKSRLLILKNRKTIKKLDILNKLKLNDGTVFQQYFGVFSASNIDYATEFLIKNLNIKNTDKRVLDLASGNGILAYEVRKRNSVCEIHLLDDSFLAIESSRLNIAEENVFFHYSDSLEEFDSEIFDLVISNPPFHFEYEINTEISINLFKDVARCLKFGGRFQLVANKHLNYNIYLKKYFKQVSVVSANKKFIIYECIK